MRYFGIVSYKGAHYDGFQRQKDRPSVQKEIERVLSFLLGEEILIAGAGRTDAKVHALGQTFTFDCRKALGPHFLFKANRLLPPDIHLLSIEEKADSFHARHSCCGKEYIYRFLPSGKRPFEVETLAQLHRDDFDEARFVEALNVYKGKHNFQNFTTKKDDVDSFIRDIWSIDVAYDGEIIEVKLRANGFMTYQIRIMLGVAFKVALRQLEVKDVEEALNRKERRILSFKAPPEGLYLAKVLYEE